MTVSLIDQSATTFVTTLGGGAITSMLVIGLLIYAVLKLFENNRDKFNPHLHMPHPPTIDQRPLRGLPPGRDCVAWEAKKDKEKDDLPWN